METTSDPNNNNTGEKSYSLRPRAVSKKDEEETDVDDSWRPRGRAKRRSKQKGLPLSKYRRKTANARERSRMREINDAFEALRKALPHFNTRSDNGEKTTKIMTLRLAMKYIAALDNVLRHADVDSDAESLISDSPASREHSLTPSSLSEQSDIFDQLFVTSSLEDYPPSASSSSCAVSPFLRDTLKSPHGNHSTVSKLDSTQSILMLHSAPVRVESAQLFHLSTSVTAVPTVLPSCSSSPRPPVLPTYPLHTASTTFSSDCYTPPVDQMKDSLSPVDIQEYAATSWREFDCLPSSPMNLDDFFIT